MKNVLSEYIKLQLILYDLENEYPKMSEDGKRNFKELFKMFNIAQSFKDYHTEDFICKIFDRSDQQYVCKI